MPKKRDLPRYQAEAEAREKAKLPAKGLMARRFHLPNSSYCRDHYEDYPFTCSDCGAAQVWTAEQQKWWHEKAGGSIYAFAVRCRPCRMARVADQRGTPRRSHRDRCRDKDS